MGKVIAGATVSLDGFIADESDRVGPLFDWYNNGEFPFNGGDPQRVFHVSAASAAYMEETWSHIGAAVTAVVCSTSPTAGTAAGVRFFGGYGGPPALLGNPRVVQGDRVTHLRYEVQR